MQSQKLINYKVVGKYNDNILDIKVKIIFKCNV